MAVSPAVRRYYAERIFAQSTRAAAPMNFRPLDVPPTGVATVEGCRGGGKNILEIFLVGVGQHVRDLRASCGLCNPAMYAAADLVVDWARGRALDEILALDVLAAGSLDALFAAADARDRPEDLREKLQYALLTLQRAVHAHRGTTAPPLPAVPEPRAADDDEG